MSNQWLAQVEWQAQAPLVGMGRFDYQLPQVGMRDNSDQLAQATLHLNIGPGSSQQAALSRMNIFRHLQKTLIWTNI